MADGADTTTDKSDREVLSVDEVREWAAAHHPWEAMGNDRLLRTFRFADFGSAMRFMAKVSPVADEMDHHPEWTNAHDRVSVALTTNDAGGVTHADLSLAEAMDSAAAEIGHR